MRLIDNSIDYGFSHKVASKYGVISALILNRIVWSINYHMENGQLYKDKYYINDQWWMEDTAEAIVRHFRNIFSLNTVKRAIKEFEEDGLLISIKPRAQFYDHTKWYGVDVARFDEIINSPMITDEPTLALSIVDRPKMSLSRSTQNESIGRPKMSLSSSSKSHTISHAINPDAPPALYSLPSLDLDKKPKSPKYDEQDLAIGQAWLEFALGEMKWKTATAAWTAERFAIDLAKIRKLTGVTHEGLRDLLAFIQKDKFWQDKAFSPAGLLRKNAEGIMKIDNILIQATKTERKNEKFTAMMNSEEPF